MAQPSMDPLAHARGCSPQPANQTDIQAALGNTGADGPQKVQSVAKRIKVVSTGLESNIYMQTRKQYTISKRRERWQDDEHARFVEVRSLTPAHGLPPCYGLFYHLKKMNAKMGLGFAGAQAIWPPVAQN